MKYLILAILLVSNSAFAVTAQEARDIQRKKDDHQFQTYKNFCRNSIEIGLKEAYEQSRKTRKPQ